MNTKLSAVSDKRIDLTCSACGHEFSYKIADLILATRDHTTTHEVRQRAVRRGCGVRGNNTYHVVYWAYVDSTQYNVPLETISSVHVGLPRSAMTLESTGCARGPKGCQPSSSCKSYPDVNLILKLMKRWRCVRGWSVLKKTANGIISAYKIGKNRFLRMWRGVIFGNFSRASLGLMLS